MKANEKGVFPGDLVQARARFQNGRSQRPVGSSIPESFWNLAVRVAHLPGLSLTARVLRPDYYGLKKRSEGGDSQFPSRQPAFVQLPSPPLAVKQAVFELEPGKGTRLRVQLLGYDTADLETLARHFGGKD